MLKEKGWDLPKLRPPAVAGTRATSSAFPPQSRSKISEPIGSVTSTNALMLQPPPKESGSSLMSSGRMPKMTFLSL